MKMFSAILLLFLSSQIWAAVDATTEEERRYLLKLSEQLMMLDQLASQAEQHADPGARVKLDYTALQKDLREMRRALEQHIALPSRTPRQIPSLQFNRN